MSGWWDVKGLEKSPDQFRVLVARPDRLGDVILSTPVFEVIKRHYPGCHLTVMVRSNVAPVIRGLPWVDEVMEFDPQRGLFHLTSDIRERKFRVGVVLQSHPRIAAALLFAGVRHRVGPLSKPHSYLFYNRGLRQRRSQVEMHETDYNLQLLRRMGIRVGGRNVPPRVHVPEERRREARDWLERQGWSETNPLAIVHPGMGGSALNWPENHYVELIRSLVDGGRPVVVTGGPEEGELLQRIQSALGESAGKAWFYGGEKVGGVDALAGFFSWASVVVAPSTGPLHLAVAVGKPVVTFYPPVRVQSAIRWGPYVVDEKKASISVPEVYCGQDFECRGMTCHYFPCMTGLSVSDAFARTQEYLEAASRTARETQDDVAE